jgi:hypothetical protein|tara:strand:- start:221 stop:895 length:675 start_codon:yes stop_codon:yes gene_type:complete
VADENNKLIGALIKAYSDITSAEFDKVNPHFKSKYASLESVIKAVKPSLLKHGILYRQVSKYTENGICIETIFHGHGEELGTGEIFLPVDKRTAQGFGSALTYARRYSLSLACGIGSEEDDDGNQAEKEVGKKPVPKKDPEPVKEEPKQEDDFDYNEAWSEAFVDGFLKVVTIAKTPDEVKSQYKANAEQIKVLKDKFPDQKKRLDDLSLQYVENLKESSEEVK